MIQLERIKLVIWDLDDTFWEGILSEGSVVIPKDNRQLIIRLTDIGIVNTICSKNNFDSVREELERNNLWDYFVFPSINWEAKGNRVKQLISDMQLRPANILFLDDNPSNREEVKFFCPGVMAEGPEVLPELIELANNSDKEDIAHKRLQQYKILEEKHEEKKSYSSNEEFLYESHICVTIKKDCLEKLDRIYELNIRANQLNFTKLRSTKEGLKMLLMNPAVEAGYVCVNDKFGDYGIVGFYALKDGALVHFVFSCRTLGMGIEQWVYNQIGRPELVMVGEVISDLSITKGPGWINQKKKSTQGKKMQIRDLQKHKVLVKGPCDLYQVYPYIAQTELFDTDFTHTTDKGVLVESTGHTTHLVEAGRLTQEQKSLVLSEVPFVTADIYDDSFYHKGYKVIFISILTDANLGVYQRKVTGEKLAFLEYLHPMTDPSNWDGIISGRYHNAGFPFTRDILQDFAEKYEYLGRNTAEQTVANLDYVWENLPKECILSVMLGGELYYKKNMNPAYADRHLIHKQMNTAIRHWAEGKSNVRLMDVNKYLTDQSSFYDHFNHYIKPVYYALAKEMVDIVNEATGSEIKETSKWKMAMIRAKEMFAPMYYRIRRRLR